MRKIAWLANSTAIVVFRVHGLVVYYLFFLPLLDVVIFLEMTPIECVSGSSKIICRDLFWCTAYKYYDKIESKTNFLKKNKYSNAFLIEWNFNFFFKFQAIQSGKTLKHPSHTHWWYYALVELILSNNTRSARFFPNWLLCANSKQNPANNKLCMSCGA